ncbi:MAG TPA: GNAT family N-acetyltransferase [Methylomirabilota bacterium]|nr:GNAT family N-acetyltransferase [Methylomirabilota bacterium]
MQGSLKLRPAARGDLPAILAIYNDAVLSTTATYDYEPRTLEHRIAWFEDHAQQGYPIFVVEGDSNEVLGWGSLSRFHDRPGYRFTTENSIYVAAPHRGKGVGKALLRALIAAARAKGLRCVIAIIDADNAASIHLHAQHGFFEVGRFQKVGFKFGRWLDVVYMELLFDAA